MSDSFLLSNPQTLYQDVLSGAKLYPLSSDIAFKRFFSPDHHPERINALLQGITDDKSIEVASPLSNEGVILTKDSKKVIFDLPARLDDDRAAVTEIQKSPQSYAVKRAEIYSANMLTNQYAAEAGRAKGDIDYKNIKGTILVILMVRTPSGFCTIPSPDDTGYHPYIQKITHIISDEGVEHNSLQKIYFVELDECLRQYKAGINLCCTDAELQFHLSAICDINDPYIAKSLVDGKHG